jgi:hypothetical protein
MANDDDNLLEKTVPDAKGNPVKWKRKSVNDEWELANKSSGFGDFVFVIIFIYIIYRIVEYGLSL